MLRKLLDEHDVSTTALLANYWKSVARRKENWDRICQQKGARDKDLFKDDFMEYFIDEAVAAAGNERLDKKMWLPLATRSRFFRKTVSRHVKQGEAEQVIILGSGFDTLAVRKQKYTEAYGAKFFEIDKPNVLACKQAVYNNNHIHQNATYIPLDYVQADLRAELAKSGVDFSKPTLVLWEGNLFYLEKKDVIGVLKNLTSIFSKLVISFDYMHGVMQEKTTELDSAAKNQALQTTLTEFARKKSPFKSFFEPAEMNALCESLGLTFVERKTAAELAILYDVDTDPFYTAKPYSVSTFKK